MANTITSSKVKGYLRTNWIKIGLAALLLIILMKKDLSFSVDLNAPDPSPIEDEMLAPPASSKGTKKEILSEKRTEADKTQLSMAPLENLLSEKEERIDKFWTIEEYDKEEFINRFTHVAENEQLKYGVPASVILASGLLMSEAGNTSLSREGNNFFALPCTADWMGQEGYHGGKCFRYYENAWTSFRDNSLYLTTYLFPGKQLPADDYKGWVTALEQVKYGDEPNLAAQLAKIIDHYDLHELDK